MGPDQRMVGMGLEWMMLVATSCLAGWHMKLKMIDLPRVVENSFVSDYQLGREIVW